MNRYIPKPVDTSAVALDPALLELAEYLANNTHEVWAAGRIREGWTWGPQRDDHIKQHPGLIPYEKLADVEKQFDRQTAIETLKLITALGYRIEPPPGLPGVADSGKALPAELSSAGLAELIQLWRESNHGGYRGGPQVHLAMARRALVLGESLLAYDILKEGLKYHPSDVGLRQSQALSLARSGATQSAIGLLEELRDAGHDDEETVSLLARCYKDRWEHARGAGDAREWLAKSCDAYEQAYRQHGGYWSAINVATLALCLGQADRAQFHANAARNLCSQLLNDGDSAAGAYWVLATLGEAELVLGNLGKAEEYYRDARRAAPGQWGNFSTTRRNARLILEHRQISSSGPAQWLDQLLPMPRVVVFSGCRFDLFDPTKPGIAPELEAAVAREIAQALSQLNCGFGYSCANPGAEILFLEAVLQRGGEANIVLPYDTERFIRQRVTAGPAAGWEQRLRRLLAAPNTRLIIASDGELEDEQIANDYANRFTLGLAGVRAWQLGAELAPLAVCHAREPDGSGATADAVARWKACGCDATIINLNQLAPELTTAPPTPAVVDRKNLPVRMLSLLFADVAGFSKFNESEIRLFVKHFLEPVAQLARARPIQPLQMNTWGDGLYFVFEFIADAGKFALDLTDLVSRTQWVDLGFRRPLSLRTALHVGPVYEYLNPATGRTDYLGTHVSRTARMEPVTPSGQVYASEAFAAIAFAQRVDGFVCEYVGQVGLAKNYGTFPTYHVRRQ